ncbi:Clp protease N-terminal domain-containing protein [Kribbella sp. NBC_01245]|uniref:Clp protease N-terminal domain-containing protein n=1 Tax=Kribbella sp. NBC_01245 TaxID=2903578 RepID=UPI002E28DB80|nr:Clp protease N-terminal domain-containing protein [Kribbella sp. NBC_01245]
MSTESDVRKILVDHAREEARIDGSATIEAEHLLLALATRDGTSAQRVLVEAGLDREAIRLALQREWQESLAAAGVNVDVSALPISSPDPKRKPGIGATARLALERSIREQTGGTVRRIGPSHMLAGLLATDRGRVARALALADIDREHLLAQAIAAEK